MNGRTIGNESFHLDHTLTISSIKVYIANISTKTRENDAENST